MIIKKERSKKELRQRSKNETEWQKEQPLQSAGFGRGRNACQRMCGYPAASFDSNTLQSATAVFISAMPMSFRVRSLFSSCFNVLHYILVNVSPDLSRLEAIFCFGRIWMNCSLIHLNRLQFHDNQNKKGKKQKRTETKKQKRNEMAKRTAVAVGWLWQWQECMPTHLRVPSHQF